MKCLACDCILSDREASRKYINWREMPEGEDRYIGLCDKCIQDTGLSYTENLLTTDEELNDDDSDSATSATALDRGDAA